MSDQLRLFADETAQPAGFSFQPRFVSAEEERTLINRIGELPLAPFQFGTFEGKRRVAFSVGATTIHCKSFSRRVRCRIG